MPYVIVEPQISDREVGGDPASEEGLRAKGEKGNASPTHISSVTANPKSEITDELHYNFDSIKMFCGPSSG